MCWSVVFLSFFGSLPTINPIAPTMNRAVDSIIQGAMVFQKTVKKESTEVSDEDILQISAGFSVSVNPVKKP